MSGVFIGRGTKQRARRNVSLGRACICHPSALRPARSHYSGAEAVGVKALIKQVHTSFATTRVARLADWLATRCPTKNVCLSLT